MTKNQPEIVRYNRVELLRHGQITAAKAGLDVRHLDAAFLRGNRIGKRRVDVVDNNNEVVGAALRTCARVRASLSPRGSQPRH